MAQKAQKVQKIQDGQNPYKRNRYTFGIGTIGRDALYTLVSMFLIYYFTSVAHVSTGELWWIVAIVTGWRVVDAVSDPLMGVIVDNTRSRWGKHKLWIAIGAVLSGIFTVLFFSDFGLKGAAAVVFFAVVYVFWSATYSLNDIAFWSYVPALTQDLKERENIGAKARIFALIGTFFVVAGITPITEALGKSTGGLQQGYFWFAVCVVALMWAGQLVTLFGVKEPKGVEEAQERTSIRDFFRAIFRNDQLLYITVAMGLFMIGYTTTTSFGIFYFQYVYGDKNMYSIFALILGLSQIASLVAFPWVAKYLKRKSIYLIATVLVVLGYGIFFVAPVGTMLFVGIAGVLIFVGQAGIQLLMLLFLADTVDYGHWKLGKRNDSVTFSLQPFIYKVASAAATGITGAVAAVTGLNHAPSNFLLTGGDLLLFKSAMFILPLLCILVGYLIYHFAFHIDEEEYAKIHADLVARGEIADTTEIVGTN
jgi:melibiose permease/lactose/raffinose/galactose permease